MKASRWRRALTIGAIALVLPACTLRGTTQQTTDTTQNTTVSTSGKSWITEDGLVRQGEAVNAFAALNYDNLKTDMAAGGGEYLASLGTLMGVPHAQQPAFFQIVQGHYAATSNANLSSGDFLAGLDGTLAAQSSSARR